MKEKIYTIPVMDAFRTDCECPICILEKKLEDDAVEYTLGPSMMEPDSRIESNEKGFCNKHFKLLYGQKNRLSLALIIDTHLSETNHKLSSYFKGKLEAIRQESNLHLAKNLLNKFSSKSSQSINVTEQLVNFIDDLEHKCVICEKVAHTMERYIDVIFYLWKKEEEFKGIFKNSKGFCIHHFKILLEGAKKHLGQQDLSLFLLDLLPLQLEHLQRVQQEVNWFTKKFDYRYNDAPWGNSKDAVPRSIEKIVGYSRLE
ncbi:MAG: transporter substrate-binding protein [Clostridia bacterium]|jgi:hypothetical protein|uniref:DUF6062 family protein n=1 Tax=Petroclostridium xylanilyticum TaxID=1792311 RepID=UPI000B997871|nr:DUF6062 family protein [Petroclostridium xylanilyticum]MBZ4646174.1 transporter substrate-binding protein [Clostridia bacterium]